MRALRKRGDVETLTRGSEEGGKDLRRRRSRERTSASAEGGVFGFSLKTRRNETQRMYSLTDVFRNERELDELNVRPKSEGLLHQPLESCKTKNGSKSVRVLAFDRRQRAELTTQILPSSTNPPDPDLSSLHSTRLST